MADFVDAWRGFALRHPDGWRPAFPPVEGVAFVPPDGQGFLELAMVPTADARQAVRDRVGLLNPPQSQPLSQSAEQAATAFSDDRSRGEVHARLAGGGALVAFAQLPADGALEPHQLIADLVGSLKAAEPVGRTRWVEPTEGAFSLLVPTGWQVQGGIRPGPPGRDVVARIARDERTVVSLEPSMAVYSNGPAMFGMGPSVPLQPGLEPLFRQVVQPQLARAYGGRAQVLGYQVWTDPMAAEARVALPDGSVLVLFLEAVPMPGTPSWVGGVKASYQAPADQLADVEAVLRGVAASSTLNQQWRANETARSRQAHQQTMNDIQAWGNLKTSLHNQRMHDIAAAGAANTAIHNQRMASADQQLAGWQRQSEASDQIQHDTVNAVRGVSDYLDQGTGRVYEVADGYEHVWTDRRGSFVATDWQLDPSPDWTELRRFAPGEYHP